MKSTGFYVVGAGLLLSGLACLLAGLCMVDFKVTGLGTDMDLESESATLDCPENINITDKNVPVFLSASKDDSVHLNYFTNHEDVQYRIDETDGTLNIVKEDNSHWWEHMFVLEFSSPSLEVQIPKEFNGDLTVETRNGKIRLEDVDLDGEVSLNTSNGHVDISRVSVADALTCESSNGKIELTDIEAESVNIKTSNGKVEMEDVTSETELRCKTSNAKIELRRIDSGSYIYLKSSNGAIVGEIAGRQSDYSIQSDTSNGHNNLPEHSKDGEKKLEVDTSNGRIDIDFSEDE